ncbi:hypothetical protein [Pseudonocardia endophytica]|uniref:Uncharacterized protein n=1 Tax=Pseudonocardia endophytica TaxID=401976 RepID=A0A4R1HW70_PSEEN|nr:hypothetical protein [Pseudonocardia endophytica]TCK25265.1 hypothetical protein EV378_1068 [Pseudonocardia endophytica]
MNADERSPVPEELRALDEEIAGLPKLVERRFDPGVRAVVVAVGVMVLVAAVLLPWVAGAPGWQIAGGEAGYGPLPRLFTFTLLGFGVAGSVLALTTRWWPLAWLCAVGCGISTVNGLWAIWSRQIGSDTGLPGPEAGMVLGVVGVLLLTFTWAGIALRG